MNVEPRAENVSHSELELAIYLPQCWQYLEKIEIKNTETDQDKTHSCINSIVKNVFPIQSGKVKRFDQILLFATETPLN